MRIGSLYVTLVLTLAACTPTRVDTPSVLTEAMSAGTHQITVTTVYQGNGTGKFEYLKKFKFTVKSNHTVTVVNQQHLRVDITGFEKGDRL